MYDIYDSERRRECYNNYVSDADFKTLENEAASRGFRKASLSEIEFSATSKGVIVVDLYCWKGGLWVRSEHDRPA